jgi:hypothetical protein
MQYINPIINTTSNLRATTGRPYKNTKSPMSKHRAFNLQVKCRIRRYTYQRQTALATFINPGKLLYLLQFYARCVKLLWGHETELVPIQIQSDKLLFHFCETFAAIYRSVSTRLERNFRFFTASCTRCHVHFSLSFYRIFSRITAVFASLGFILESLFSIKFLLALCKNKFRSAVFTDKCFVLIHEYYLAFVGLKKIY